VLAKPAIFILYGEQWLGAAAPLSLLMIAQVIAVGFGMNWELFVLKDETARQTRIEGVRAVLSLSAFTIGASISLTAAAIGRIVDCLAGFVLYHSHMKRLAGVTTREMWGAFAASFLLAAGAILPPLLLMIWTDWSERTPLLPLAGAVAAGIGLWLGLAVAIRHPLVAELKRLAGFAARNRTRLEPPGS
jgi:O-antigen/teichoic acid export membrane protein